MQTVKFLTTVATPTTCYVAGGTYTISSSDATTYIAEGIAIATAGAGDAHWHPNHWVN